MEVQIKEDNFDNEIILKSLKKYKTDYDHNTPNSIARASTVEQLKHYDCKIWSAWQGEQFFGCILLRPLEKGHGEVKCFYIVEAYRNLGIGKQLLEHLIDSAKKSEFQRLSIETATVAGFCPMRQLMRNFGFSFCAPFGDYFMAEDSECMRLNLTD